MNLSFLFSELITCLAVRSEQRLSYHDELPHCEYTLDPRLRYIQVTTGRQPLGTLRRQYQKLCRSDHKHMQVLYVFPSSHISPSISSASFRLSLAQDQARLFRLYPKLMRRIGKGKSGLGGFIDVSCLRYGFYPSEILGVFASLPHPDKFWTVYPNIYGA